MEAKELRIGNWIKQPNGNNYVFIIEDTENQQSINSFDLEEIEPIPLTEEWLIKFGFILDETRESSDDVAYYWKRLGVTKFGGFFSIKRNKMHSLCSLSTAAGIYNSKNEFTENIQEKITELVPKEIEFIHDLQNKIFALTGEELTINK